MKTVVLPSLLAAPLSPEDQENPVGEMHLHYFSGGKKLSEHLKCRSLLCWYHNPWVSLLTWWSHFSRRPLLQTSNDVIVGSLLQDPLSPTSTLLTMFPLEPWTPSTPGMPCGDRQEVSI